MIELHRTQLLEIPNEQSMATDTKYPVLRLNNNVFLLVAYSEEINMDSISNNMSDGSRGQVFVVRDFQSQKIMVAKSNKPTTHTPTNSTLYESECLASLDHPNIIKHRGLAYKEGVFQFDRREIFYLMDYYDKTLYQQIPYFQNVNEIFKIAIQVAGALSYMHKKDIIHGDINPQNILLDKNSNAMISDFGISRRLFGLDKVKSSDIGTGGYTPPEQYYGVFSKKTDSYGLATIIYQLLTRTDPRIMPLFTVREYLIDKKPFCQSFMDQLGDRYESIRKTLIDALSPSPQERITVEAIRHNILVSSITNPSMIKIL